MYSFNKNGSDESMKQTKMSYIITILLTPNNRQISKYNINMDDKHSGVLFATRTHTKTLSQQY